MGIFLVLGSVPQGNQCVLGETDAIAFWSLEVQVHVCLVCRPQKFSHVCRTIFSTCSGREVWMEACPALCHLLFMPKPQ